MAATTLLTKSPRLLLALSDLKQAKTTLAYYTSSVLTEIMKIPQVASFVVALKDAGKNLHEK